MSLTNDNYEAVISEIQSRGYWSLILHPTTFQDGRIPQKDLLTTVRKSSVGSRKNWGPFPWLTDNQTIMGEKWAGGIGKHDLNLQAWQLYQSGQFRAVAGLFWDWRDISRILPANPNWSLMQDMPIGQSIVHISYMFEFASRLLMHLEPLGVEDVDLALTFRNIIGRHLIVDDPRRMPFFSQQYSAPVEEVPFKKIIPVPVLIATWQDIAIECSADFFSHFGWNPPLIMLQEMQTSLYR